VLAPFSYTQLAFASLISTVALNHVPDHWSTVGMGVIAAAGLYAILLHAWEARGKRHS
jgi:drug/metabolite transporter (DMT)-like permease